MSEKELKHMENDLRDHLLAYTQGQTTNNPGPKNVN